MHPMNSTLTPASLNSSRNDALEERIRRTGSCQTCSNVRTMALGVLAIALLAYTAPQVVTSNPPAYITVLFAAALAALPPALINNFRLLKQVFKKT